MEHDDNWFFLLLFHLAEPCYLIIKEYYTFSETRQMIIFNWVSREDVSFPWH